METYPKSLGYGVWMSVKIGYTIPTPDITDATELRKYDNDSKAKNTLLSALINTEFARVIGCETTNEVWKKLQSIHEGDEKIKEDKLLHFRAQFESLKMSDGDSIDHYMSKVNEVINAIRGLGETLKDAVEAQEWKRKIQGKNCGGIGHFASKCPKKGKIDESNDEDPQVKKSNFKKKKSFPKKKNNYKKKSLITHKDSTTTDESSEDEESDDENYETLFMATSTTDIHEEGEKLDKKEEQSEDEYDFQAELYTALKKLKVERKKIKILETQLAEESEKISQLSLIIEETKKINEDICFSLSSKIDECTQLEEEIVTLRAECELLKKTDYRAAVTSTPTVTVSTSKGKEVSVQTPEEDHHAVHESTILDEILSVQRPSNDKSGLGYEKGGVSSGVKTKGQGTTQNPVRFVGEKRKKKGSNSKNLDKRKVDRDGFTTVSIRSPRTLGDIQDRDRANLMAHSKPSRWILDSGCSTHMTGDKDKFLNLEHVGKGSVRFGNNDGARVEGKGKIRLYNEHISSNNALYVSELKHNILSVSQICDSGNEVLFTKDGCVIKKTKNGKIVAQESRTARNLYALSEGLEEMSCMISKKGVLLDDTFEALKDKPKVITPRAQ
ncbi:uncharacterized protein LOC122659136 [Telopea speciosissima]|uniref:uncharacterized protein LOC122659136 n=1 Tax=Telopea speciosissima TaxID=54955 RepID=UPI001CC6552A|nr:uncharacterized protein LOC122659136 [Telopea speciosissima]